MDPGRVVIGHADSYPHLDHYLSLINRGASIEFDFLGMSFTPTEVHGEGRIIDLLLELLHRGHGDRVLLSQDVCHNSQLRRYGGNGYTYLQETFLPRLRERGVSRGGDRPAHDREPAPGADDRLTRRAWRGGNDARRLYGGTAPRTRRPAMRGWRPVPDQRHAARRLTVESWRRATGRTARRRWAAPPGGCSMRLPARIDRQAARSRARHARCRRGSTALAAHPCRDCTGHPPGGGTGSRMGPRQDPRPGIERPAGTDPAGRVTVTNARRATRRPRGPRCP